MPQQLTIVVLDDTNHINPELIPGGAGGDGYIQAIQHPTYSGVLILTSDRNAVAAPTVDLAIAGLPSVGSDTLLVRVTATGAPGPTLSFEAQVQDGTDFYPISAVGTGGGSYTLSGLNPIVQGTLVIRVTATNSTGTVTAQDSGTATSTPTSAPVVTTHPVSYSLTAGATITLTAVASGFPTPTVQWQIINENGGWSNIANATSTSYTTPTLTTADDGTRYRAVFRNILGSVTTDAATITVVGAPAQPLVTVRPEGGGDYYFGELISLTADATGYPNPTVQWVKRTYGGEEIVLSGQTAKTLQFVATREASASQYDAIFTNVYGQARAESTGGYTIKPPQAGPPFVLQQTPADITVAAGSLMILRVYYWAKLGDEATWQQNNGSGWTDVSVGNPSQGSTRNPTTGLDDWRFQYTRTVTAGDNGLQFRAILRNTIYGGTSFSTTTTLTVS